MLRGVSCPQMYVSYHKQRAFGVQKALLLLLSKSRFPLFSPSSLPVAAMAAASLLPRPKGGPAGFACRGRWGPPACPRGRGLKPQPPAKACPPPVFVQPRMSLTILNGWCGEHPKRTISWRLTATIQNSNSGIRKTLNVVSENLFSLLSYNLFITFSVLPFGSPSLKYFPSRPFQEEHANPSSVALDLLDRCQRVCVPRATQIVMFHD